jgi:DNA-binding SARP family transcriptional activator
MPMEFRLLGAIEVVADGSSVPLGGPRQRAVLADVAIHAGRVVPTAQLIDDLWGERPPLSAIHTMETYISRLRHTFHVCGVAGATLVTRPGGYL